MRPCVYVTDRFEETLAAYERLGFPRVRAWDRGTDTRSALFRAGPAYVEVVEAVAEAPPRPHPKRWPRRLPSRPAAGTAASVRESSATRAG
jgi:hypothetical protein